MATKTDILKKSMLQALEKSLGVVTAASKKSGVARTTHYHWMIKDAKYKASVESIADMALDFAESKLMNRITRGSDTAIIFYLKTKGKKRGYIEKTEIDTTINQRTIIIDTTGEYNQVHTEAGGGQENIGE